MKGNVRADSPANSLNTSGDCNGDYNQAGNYNRCAYAGNGGGPGIGFNGGAVILHADRFDSLIEYWAAVQDMPWLLIKAVCRQESGMNPLAVSGCGAQGLMQLMPDTANGLGISNSFDPDSNLRGGISYLKNQYKHFPEIVNPDDRWDFALAAYNAGRGNINRAMATCKARREAWQQWPAVAIVLPEITGADNAKQTTGYVANILRYWSEYQSLTYGTVRL